jgi:hypothetical protein
MKDYVIITRESKPIKMLEVELEYTEIVWGGSRRR